MVWLEASALGHAMRDTGVWTYAIINLTHIFGIASLFGAVAILDLRLLGVWRQIPLVALARPATIVAGCGFAVAATTGPGLLATKATEYLGNPFLPIKFAAIVLALLNIAIVHRLPAWKERANPDMSERHRRQLAIAGGTSLICWVAAISAGRMIAYW
jgi:hypothetical protein